MFHKLSAAVCIFLFIVSIFFLLLLIVWQLPRDGVSIKVLIPITIMDWCQKGLYNFAFQNLRYDKKY